MRVLISMKHSVIEQLHILINLGQFKGSWPFSDATTKGQR